MLRWAVVAITHVFSQAKTPVAPSQAQTMCDESIPSSRKVSKGKVKKDQQSLCYTFTKTITHSPDTVRLPVFPTFPQPPKLMNTSLKIGRQCPLSEGQSPSGKL